ncbi:MAG: hypothetical protein VX001_00105 [Planctomycetota bacterium]|nr:hypothetical protein [Planctomycetota bacterium]
MNTKKVIALLKANLWSLLTLVLSLGIGGGAVVWASGEREKVESTLSERAKVVNQLDGFHRGSLDVSIAGSNIVSGSGVPTSKLIEEVNAQVERSNAYAEAFVADAESFHLRGRKPFNTELFPEPPSSKREVIPETFHGQMASAYAQLESKVAAVKPLGEEELVEKLRARRRMYLGGLDEIPEENLDDYRVAMSEQRVSSLRDRAMEGGVYLDAAALDFAPYEQTKSYALGELYLWQWDYWIREDILQALTTNNRPEGVFENPVKHIRRIAPEPIASLEGGSGQPGPGGMGMGGGAPGGSGTAGGPNSLDQQITKDLSYSLTGRQSNGVWDVRPVDILMVVETARLPEVIDELTRKNFFTVLDVSLTPVDSFAALAEGCYYGSAPVSDVALRLETVWFRSLHHDKSKVTSAGSTDGFDAGSGGQVSWWMPADLRKALGIPVADPMGDQGMDGGMTGPGSEGWR